VKKVHLGFKAFDLHELACHFVAESAGFYAEHGLDVSLMDTRLVPDSELPRSLFSAACGSAVFRWLHGEKLKVVLVAAERPMFWLYTHSDVAGLGELRGRPMATYPDPAPPAQFLRIILNEAGFQAGHDVNLIPVGNDGGRLEMLRSGRAVAALVSSAMLPGQVEALGFRQLLCIGDGLRVPTTGLAVSLDTFRRDPDTINAMRDSHRAALRLVHGDKAAIRRAIRDAKLVDARHLDDGCELLRQFFTADGRIPAAGMLDGVRRLAESLELGTPEEPTDLYDCLREG
jgi:ABC-type nitrate/sulfonate/bicarbonate transport system substrate-binding protein